jgi:hypothetical protein
VLSGYEKWIEGEYYQYPGLKKAITDKKQEIVSSISDSLQNLFFLTFELFLFQFSNPFKLFRCNS